MQSHYLVQVVPSAAENKSHKTILPTIDRLMQPMYTINIINRHLHVVPLGGYLGRGGKTKLHKKVSKQDILLYGSVISTTREKHNLGVNGNVYSKKNIFYSYNDDCYPLREFHVHNISTPEIRWTKILSHKNCINSFKRELNKDENTKPKFVEAQVQTTEQLYEETTMLNRQTVTTVTAIEYVVLGEGTEEQEKRSEYMDKTEPRQLKMEMACAMNVITDLEAQVKPLLVNLKQDQYVQTEVLCPNSKSVGTNVKSGVFDICHQQRIDVGEVLAKTEAQIQTQEALIEARLIEFEEVVDGKEESSDNEYECDYEKESLYSRHNHWGINHFSHHAHHHHHFHNLRHSHSHQIGKKDSLKK